MWDNDDEITPVINNKPDIGTSSMNGNGFYVGRGRGFGNMSQMSNSLPTVGRDSSVDDSGWDDTPTNNVSSYDNSGWDDDAPSSGFKGNQFQSAPDRSNNNWQDRNSNYDRTNDSRSNRSTKCFKCNEDGHMSRDCPNSGSGGGSKGCFSCNETGHMSRDCPNKSNNNRDRNGSSRSCFKCGEEGHMSRDCTSEGKSGGGGGRGCFKCGEEGHMSRDCTSEGKSGGGGRGCFKCGEEGHMSRDCTSEGKSAGGGRGCFKCGEEGHMSRDCTSEGKSGGGSRGCFKCGEEGHMSRDCTSEGKSGGKSGCFKCHQDGHMARDCPNEAVTEDGKPRPPPYVPPEPSDDADSLFVGVPTGINFNKYDDIHVDVSGPNAPPPIESFEASGLCQHLIKNIRLSQYLKPTPVQKYSIPIVLKRRDLMACAQTGSGKTAAFLLPILNDLITNPNLPNYADQDVQYPWAVIIAPTRELVIQIGKEARKFAYDTVVRADVLYGGTSTSYQSNRIKKGAHIIAATPGRLLDFVDKGKVSFAQLKYLVLDEADRMLDMGFAPSIKKMVDDSSMPPKGERLTLMFSATFPEEIQRMASEYLHNYLFLTVGLVGAANSDISQTFFNVNSSEKRTKLVEILKESGTSRTLVFVEKKRSADFTASSLSQQGIPTTSIHGDRLQKEREEALRDFCTGRMPVLVATAVAARGLDIKDVCHVINYDLPQTIDEYVHRIGRTGRVGNLGKATSFYDSSVDRPLARSLKKILIDAQQPIPDWLSEEANEASGTSVQYGGRSNFGSRDVRNQGRGRQVDSSNAFDNDFSQQQQSFQAPVAEEEDWG